MLRNYSVLKGTISKDLEDHIKKSKTHYNLLVNASGMEYQFNIDVQSSTAPNIKIFFTEEFNHEILSLLDRLGNDGLFKLDDLAANYRLDYLRSNILSIDDLKNTQPKSWQEISDKLDQCIKIGYKIYCLGEYYDDAQLRAHPPHGLMLRQKYGHLPSRGVHDAHMNQGTPLSMPQSESNGIYQDGAMFVKSDDKVVKAFFFIFTSQSLETDQSGNPIIN